MTEYIKREDVYLALNSHYFTGELSLRETIDSVPFADVVERTAPSVTTAWADREPSTYVLQKHGKWINQKADSEMCSACGTRFYISALFAIGGNTEPNYCPNCGADMRDDDDIPMEYFENEGI